MGSVYARGNKLWIRFKGPDGWTQQATDYTVGQEKLARRVLERLEARLAAGEVTLGELGPVTVAGYYRTWIKGREAEIQTWKNDESTFRLYVLPAIGAMRLDAVRPARIRALVKSWRGKMAPKSVHNAYSSLSAFFRDACNLADLLDATPCMLTKRELGSKEPVDPEFRSTAIFTRAELEQLISDERISLDRRVLYALEGIAGLRHGEAAGLRWRNCGVPGEPLSMIYVAFSYARPYPKGGRCRPVPVHPTLAGILAEWRLHGWAAMMGRPPSDDDFVVPLPPEAVTKRPERYRSKGYSFDRFETDLVTLGLRHRRGHDLRRTMISLARSDGAQKDILRRATHKPPAEVIEGYSWFEWPVVCAEVLKLKVQRRGESKVIELPLSAAAGDRDGLATVLATSPGEVPAGILKSGVALPGLEPGSVASVSVGFGQSGSVAHGDSGASAAPPSSDGAAPAEDCSNVARRKRPYRKPAVQSSAGPWVYPGRGDPFPPRGGDR